MCQLCKKQAQKLVFCPLLGGKLICLKCCFSISTGDPQMLKKIKSQTKLLKHTVLKKCLVCIEKTGTLIEVEK